jgi:hypothetical protein
VCHIVRSSVRSSVSGNDAFLATSALCAEVGPSGGDSSHPRRRLSRTKRRGIQSRSGGGPLRRVCRERGRVPAADGRDPSKKAALTRVLGARGSLVGTGRQRSRHGGPIASLSTKPGTAASFALSTMPPNQALHQTGQCPTTERQAVDMAALTDQPGVEVEISECCRCKSSCQIKVDVRALAQQGTSFPCFSGPAIFDRWSRCDRNRLPDHKRASVARRCVRVRWPALDCVCGDGRRLLYCWQSSV